MVQGQHETNNAPMQPTGSGIEAPSAWSISQQRSARDIQCALKYSAATGASSRALPSFRVSGPLIPSRILDAMMLVDLEDAG